MTHSRDALARDLWRLLEPIHAVTYFSPEPLAALKATGYRGFWMGYFAGRAAPLGEASPQLVHALFYNFDYDHVARALPDAWQFAPPAAAIDARLSGSVAALRRQLGDAAASPDVARAAELAERAARTPSLDGRPLHAANRALPWPDEPLARLWHAATLLREHRGDGHLAVLAASGIGGRLAHVLHALATETPQGVYAVARNLGQEEWESHVAELRARDLADADGRLTEAGHELKRGIEARTDELARTPYDALSDAEVDDLLRLLRPVTAAVVATGEIPRQSPMGLDLGEGR